MLYIHIAQLINRLLPSDLRAFHATWLYALLSPLKWLNSRFVEFTGDIRYKMVFNGQIILLEHILNDMFDPVDRTIIILDGDLSLPIYAYNESESIDVYSYDESESDPSPYSYDENESLGVHFIVQVPGTIPTDNVQLISIINYYKPLGKTYKIIQ